MDERRMMGGRSVPSGGKAGEGGRRAFLSEPATVEGRRGAQVTKNDDETQRREWENVGHSVWRWSGRESFTETVF